MEDAEEFCIEDEGDEEEQKARPIIKNAMDLQRLKIEKLMKNPDKPIMIPEPSKEKDFMQSVPTFVRNVMGSSAGAGSGEFHVYRHLRRKEYARQKYIQAKSIREQLDDEYRQKLEQNRLVAEAKTAKKRAKRLKKKQKNKQKGKRRKREDEESQNKEDDLSETSESEDDEEKSDYKKDSDVVAEKEAQNRQNLPMQQEEGTDESNDTCNNDNCNISKKLEEAKLSPSGDSEADKEKGLKSETSEIVQSVAEKEEQGPEAKLSIVEDNEEKLDSKSSESSEIAQPLAEKEEPDKSEITTNS